MTTALHLIWEYLCSRDVEQDHTRLFRTAAARPITGHPVAGWVG